MKSRADSMLADLKRAGLKLTPQRIAIVRELADDRTHPTAQSLFERLRPAFPTMSFATVYNTLDTLTRCGLVQPMGALSHGGGVRFDPNTEPHHHAVCDVCGAIHDIPVDRIDVAAPASDPTSFLGFRVLREQRTYRGLGSQCTASPVS
jgi:Fur family peroxide stress response transcriptional regulator